MITGFTKQEHLNIAVSKDLERELKISYINFFHICVIEWCKLNIL